MTQQRPTSNLSNRTIEREQCFKHLSSDPGDLTTRLQLARLFFEDKFYEFAVRELIEIKRRADFPPPSLDRLLAAFGDIAQPYLKAQPNILSDEATEPAKTLEESAGGTVAELDIDAEFADLLVDLEDEEDE